MIYRLSINDLEAMLLAGLPEGIPSDGSANPDVKALTNLLASEFCKEWPERRAVHANSYGGQGALLEESTEINDFGIAVLSTSLSKILRYMQEAGECNADDVVTGVVNCLSNVFRDGRPRPQLMPAYAMVCCNHMFGEFLVCDGLSPEWEAPKGCAAAPYWQRVLNVSRHAAESSECIGVEGALSMLEEGGFVVSGNNNGESALGWSVPQDEVAYELLRGNGDNGR